MVRLKGLSIIRRSFRIQISIPYGAIKRDILTRLDKELWLFQFLMVRLKVSKTKKLNFSTVIFQFLMVRLKAVVFYCFKIFYLKFQFLMVRLKEILFRILS